LGTDRKANPLPNFRSSEKTPATITSMSKSSHMNHKGPEDTVDMRYWAASAWAKVVYARELWRAKTSTVTNARRIVD
jgi:hypothetical protein